MSTRRLLSDLKNYKDVLNEVEENNPVILTRNGRGEYAIVRLEEYNQLKATVSILTHLEAGDQSSREKGWLSAKTVEEQVRL